jgi:hypothetical protein
MRHMESPNLVASCATETKAILPNLICVQWDSAWATHDMSVDAYTRKTCTRGEVGPDRLLDRVVNCGHSWRLRGSRVSCCQVLSLARCIIDSFESPRHPRIWGGLFVAPKYSNYTFIMLYLVHEADIDSLVVDEIINIKIV